MLQQLRAAVVSVLVLTVLTGLIFPSADHRDCQVSCFRVRRTAA